MKKVILALVCVVFLMFSSCAGEGEETTAVETQPMLEPTSYEPPSLNEMSPGTIDVSLPEELKRNTWEIDFSAFEQIEAKDSVFPESTHDKILKSDNAQYFFVENDIKIHAVFFDKDERVTASASYNTETGFIEFYGDDTTTWYFNNDGTLKCVVYTYSFGAGTPSIYTFYSPEGQKEVTRTMDGWYDAEYNILTNEEILDCLDRYSGTIESTAEYKSSDITL
ncbi:MAG: hypothetical protein IKL47_01130 [Clostridia bacterium]|nr:hypothetical protein [Clostridia bacterium]